MRFHVYNGLNSQCDMSGFSLQYGDSEPIPLNFSTKAPLIPEDSIPFVPQDVEFTVKVPTEPVDCGNMKVDFNDFKFSGPPKDHVVCSHVMISSLLTLNYSYSLIGKKNF